MTTIVKDIEQTPIDLDLKVLIVKNISRLYNV